MKLILLKPQFAVCKLADMPDLSGDWLFYAKTPGELSLVCTVQDAPQNAVAVESGWRAVKIAGTLDFSLVGILSGILAVLAAESISVFAVSTYDTDYILIKEVCLSAAIDALERAGHSIEQM